MNRSHLSIAAALLVSAILVPVARGGIMTPKNPDGSPLAEGTKFRVVFVTSTTTPATSNLASTYDGIVDGAATLLKTYYGQPVTWQAIVTAGGTVANVRLPSSSVPWYIMDSGQNWYKVSEGNCWSGSLLHAINLNQSGNALSSSVWTGTKVDGTASTFTLGSPPNGGISLATFGDSNSAGATWIIASGDNSDPQSTGYHLYGVSSVITAVPEPGSLTLCLFGLVVGGGYAISRRKKCVASETL